MASKKKKKNIGGKIALGILKSPYYVGRGIYRLSKKAEVKSTERKVRKKRDSMSAEYEDFGVVSTHAGDYGEWMSDLIEAESRIGIILGARGSGKSAIGIKLLENIFSKTNRNCYAMGFTSSEMPAWINVVEKVEEINNNGIVLIDEGGVLFSSRKSMSSANKLLSDLILIARHKNLSILFISQNSSNLDVNIIRQADFLVLKPTSLLQRDFERKKIKDIYGEVEKEFEKYKDNKGLTHIYSGRFRGFVSNPLPSFWNVRISKSFG
jgi:hypothetical protein